MVDFNGNDIKLTFDGVEISGSSPDFAEVGNDLMHLDFPCALPDGTVPTRSNLKMALTIDLNAAVVDEPALREPHLEAEGGWLAPNGDYYGCNYEANQRHETTADLIVEKFDLPIADEESAQEYLCNMGWIRIDIEDIQFERDMPSPKQMNTLRQLSLIDDPRLEWRSYIQPEIDMFIMHYEAKSKRLKLGY